LPEDAVHCQAVEHAAREVARLYGYGEIRTPTFEDTSLFLRSVGGGTDIVDKEMYSFRDKGGGELTLRPEGTAGIVRAYLEHGLSNRPQPVRLHSLIHCFRYDRPQRGRYREFHQWDCEAIGDPDPQVDGELIALLWRFYGRLGLRNLSLQINSIGDANCRPAYLDALRQYYHPLAASLCGDCQRRLDTNPLRLLDCKTSQCQAAVAGAPRLVDHLCEACAAHFEAVSKYVAALQIPTAVNATLVRGLDYYTRTVFEVWPESTAAQAALGGGGRYDGLVEQLGGRPTAAVGFATGIERIILAMREQQTAAAAEPPARVFVIPLGDAARWEAARFAELARDRKISALMGNAGRGLRASLRQVNSLGVPWAAILGDDEVAAGAITLKNMTTGAQDPVTVQAALARLEGAD
jgi:histidyl-tRNA synthetase